MPNTLRERLESKLKRMPSGCLEFTGSRSKAGYGKLYTHSISRKPITDGAHRIAYSLYVGPIPDGIDVLHSCDNPPCCEKSHLFLGTQADNMQDKKQKGRAKPGPVSRSEWWTPERRAIRSAQRNRINSENRRLANQAAGVALDWKRCPACETWLAPEKFNKNQARHDGLAAHCLLCRRYDRL